MKNFCFIFLLTIFFSGYSSEKNIPQNSRIDRQEFLSQYIKPNSVGAEIGVYKGAFSYHFLLSKKPKKLYLIDSWCTQYVGNGRYETSSEIIAAGDTLYENVCQLFSDYENVEIIRLKSEEAAELFEDNFFDYIYIDAEHSYNAVLSDLTHYLPKVKPGGYLIGDDYGWTGIDPAIQEFLRRNSHECKFIDAKAGQYVLKKFR